MFVVKSDRKFACFVKKSADHFVDYFIGLNVFPICLARSVLLFLENTLTVETTAIRENRIAPGIISESHFLVEMTGIEPGSRYWIFNVSENPADSFADSAVCLSITWLGRFPQNLDSFGEVGGSRIIDKLLILQHHNHT